MTWPSGDVDTTGMDSGSDTPPRATFLSWAQKFNLLINHFSSFMQRLMTSADAAAARSELGAAAKGANSDITSLGGLATPLSIAQGGTGSGDDGRLAQPGDIKTTARSTAPTGWLKANGLTIGNSLSGATSRANADTEALFTVLWNDWSNTVLPIQTSSGSAGTRGASASADFAANKRLPVPDFRGEFTRGLDDGRGIDAGRVLGSSQPQQTRVDAGRFNSASSVTAAQLSAAGRVSPGHASWDETIPISSPNHGLETRPRNVALLYCIKL